MMCDFARMQCDFARLHSARKQTACLQKRNLYCKSLYRSRHRKSYLYIYICFLYNNIVYLNFRPTRFMYPSPTSKNIGSYRVTTQLGIHRLKNKKVDINWVNPTSIPQWNRYICVLLVHQIGTQDTQTKNVLMCRASMFGIWTWEFEFPRAKKRLNLFFFGKRNKDVCNPPNIPRWFLDLYIGEPYKPASFFSKRNRSSNQWGVFLHRRPPHFSPFGQWVAGGVRTTCWETLLPFANTKVAQVIFHRRSLENNTTNAQLSLKLEQQDDIVFSERHRKQLRP